ncbi:SWI/SNF chromatin remodeling complex protein [Pseudoscourfieldia marina]
MPKQMPKPPSAAKKVTVGGDDDGDDDDQPPGCGAAWQEEVGEEAAYVSKNKDAGDAVVVAPSPAKPGRLQKANKKANGWRGVLGGSESEWSALRGAVAGEIGRHRMKSVRHCDESSSSEMSGESSEASGDTRRASLGEEEEEAMSAKS